MAIKVTCKVQTYDTPQKAPINVHSHWHDRNMVELVDADGKPRIWEG